MTVPTEVNRIDYDGNGTATEFPFPFRIFKDDDLTVVKTAETGDSTLVLNSDYTVDGAGDYEGGTVILTDPLDNGNAISIVRILDIIQLTDLRNAGAFYAETHEDVFDYSRMVDQQLNESLDRALLFPVGSGISGVTLPLPEQFGILSWNAEADAIENISLDDSYHPVIAEILRAEQFADQARADADRAESAVSGIETYYKGAATEPPETDTLGALYFDLNQNELKVYDGTQWINVRDSSRVVDRFQATEGQTLFQTSAGSERDNTDVYFNGVRLRHNDGWETDGVNVTLRQPAALGDQVEIVTYTEADESTGTSSGGVSSSLVYQVEAGESIGAYRAVFIDADEKLYHAERTNPEHADVVLGITREAGLTGDLIDVQMGGVIVNQTWSWVGGQEIWLYDDGLLVQEAPDAGAVTKLGIALSPTAMKIDIEPPVVAFI